MKTGDLIFVRGKSPLERAIEFFDDGPFNHVCMAMPNDTIVESQYVVNTRCIPNPYKESEIEVVDLGLSKESRQVLVNSMFKYLPEKYDIRQIFGILIHDIFGLPTNKTWNSKSRFICSELVVNLLKDIGYFKDHSYFYDVDNLTPNSLYAAIKVIQANSIATPS